MLTIAIAITICTYLTRCREWSWRSIPTDKLPVSFLKLNKHSVRWIRAQCSGCRVIEQWDWWKGSQHLHRLNETGANVFWRGLTVSVLRSQLGTPGSACYCYSNWLHRKLCARSAVVRIQLLKCMFRRPLTGSEICQSIRCRRSNVVRSWSNIIIRWSRNSQYGTANSTNQRR